MNLLRSRTSAFRCQKAHAGVENIKSWEFTTASLLYRHSAHHAPARPEASLSVWCLLSASNIGSKQWQAQGPLVSSLSARHRPACVPGSGTDPPAYSHKLRHNDSESGSFSNLDSEQPCRACRARSPAQAHSESFRRWLPRCGLSSESMLIQWRQSSNRGIFQSKMSS